jgi:hypothetical protein
MTAPSPLKRVFLSSVVCGLENYRVAVSKAIHEMDGYHCVRMEDFGARDARPADFCADTVRSCSIFVGLIGQRYGSCPPESSISYSELEYNTALSAKIPRLMFLASKDFLSDAAAFDNDGSQAKLEAFRQRVLQDRVRAAFSTEQELAKLVVTALHNLEHRPEAPLSCEVYCVPTLMRAEGYTEPIGDIRIALTGGPRPEQINVMLTLSSNITNRIDSAGLSDATLISTNRRVRTQGRVERNKILFERVVLDLGRLEADEILTIMGVRADAEFMLGGGYLNGLLEITIADQEHPVFSGPVVVGLIAGGVAFSVRRESNDVAIASFVVPDESCVRAFTLDFISPFPGAFKTREEELPHSAAALLRVS